VNWTIVVAILFSLGHVLRPAGSRQLTTADTDPEIWPKWLAISACLLFLWAIFLWCIPRLSPVLTVQSRIDRTYVEQHKTRQGNIYFVEFVLFRQTTRAFAGPFGAPKECLLWPTNVDVTYSYRKWDRNLLSFSTANKAAQWQDLDPYYDGLAFICLFGGVILFLVAYLRMKDRDTSLQLTA
jgi:hypothetical protein